MIKGEIYNPEEGFRFYK